MDIKGKVFIVTGGASGLGEGTARMLAAEGRPAAAEQHASGELLRTFLERYVTGPG